MDLSAIALSGLEAAGAAVESAGRRLTAATSPEAAADTVDLSQAMVGLLASQRQFEASLALLDAANQMHRHVLDILA